MPGLRAHRDSGDLERRDGPSLHGASPSPRLRLRARRFGAGFASFYYLKTLPFDYIKIDGTFVQGLATSNTDQLVIAAIVDVARGMGKKTIAEFVADQATSDLLRDNGVDYAQGFHIAAPRPVDDVLAEPELVLQP